MSSRRIIEYILAALVVLILGGLSGWYLYLRAQTNTTAAQDAARGYGVPSNNTFGNGFSVPGGVADFTPATPQAPAASVPPRLWQVQGKPVAGMRFVGSGSSARLRFVERASGNVYDADPTTGVVVRLTNTLIPKIYEAQIIESGRIIGRSRDTAGNITTFIGTISTSTAAATTSAQSLERLNLEKNIARIVAHPYSNELFYLISDGAGVTGIRSAGDGSKQKRVFDSAILHWRPLWLSDGRIVLVQAASDGVPGYAYELKSGALVSLVPALPGLTVLPRASSSALLYGQSTEGSLTLFAKLGAETTAAALPIATIADKCVWSATEESIAYCGVPQGIAPRNFLDGWYRGVIHSSDAFWKVDARAGSAELFFAPSSGTSLDIENLTMDRGGTYLSFINRSDASLWVLRINE